MPVLHVVTRRLLAFALVAATAAGAIVAQDLLSPIGVARAGSLTRAAAPPAPATTATAPTVPPTTAATTTTVAATTTTRPRPTPSSQPARPPVAPVASPRPISAPNALGSASSYIFEGTNPDGTPYRWNPCAAIHYMVSTAEAPSAQAIADLRTAVGMVSAVTHIPFVFDGTSNALPSSSWLTSAPAGPDGWPDVLMGWEHTGQSDINLANYAAAGTLWQASAIIAGGSGFGMASGAMAFNLDHTELTEGFGVRSWGEAYLHELGHLMGLNHVNDPTQMMNPSIPDIAARYGAGDLAGLTRLGTGSCITVHGR